MRWLCGLEHALTIESYCESNVILEHNAELYSVLCSVGIVLSEKTAHLLLMFIRSIVFSYSVVQSFLNCNNNFFFESFLSENTVYTALNYDNTYLSVGFPDLSTNCFVLDD